ncbi:MAG TPA: PD-(D/E)XK nuclease family protein [Bacteroidales bacterium]|nr:PD-(D/E)XK nuclease family protein [Bacteroidales bacterium]
MLKKSVSVKNTIIIKNNLINVSFDSFMFLQRIARVFYNEYKADIRKLTFVFPNRRAGYFFQKYLTEQIDKPLFSPEIVTINDCFVHASSRQLVDRTAALFRIYRIYKEISKSDENFDSFVFWGEMLLADFDDVDKSMVDAKQLFKNVKDLKEIDLLHEYLTEDQRNAIKKFWNHFLPTNDFKTKEEYIALWKILFPIYEQFRDELLKENLATEGMIAREVIDALQKNEISEYFANKNFVFIGFNALNKSEEMLFQELKKLGKADFYWDYEADELRDEENQASRFYKDNINNFPSKLKIEPSFKPLSDRAFNLISIASSVGQAKKVHNLLSELYPKNSDKNDWIKTAVVLPDENLLQPMLHSFPANIESINVTMGFPLKSTPVASLLESIFELHRRVNSKGYFYHLIVSNILNHPYVRTFCQEKSSSILQEILQSNIIYVKSEIFEGDELLELIFTSNQNPESFVDYLLRVLQELNILWNNLSKENEKHYLECDFLYQYYTVINRMNDVMKSEGKFEMSLDTLVRLIRQLIGGISIPFEGEPLNGLQVMGMLETRGLDFENLIVCSFNEGVFPKKSVSNSFVPNLLRRAFEMPTEEYFDAVSAYNFYRLIQRTKNIYFIYDSRTDGLQTGEPSRYVHQLSYHYNVNFNKINVTYDVSLQQFDELLVKKTDEIMQKLEPFLVEGENSRALSASSLLDYIQCPLRFYFKHVEQIYEQEEVEETIGAGTYGTILHGVITRLYEHYEGKFVTEEALTVLSKNKSAIQKAINLEFAKNYNKQKLTEDEMIELEGKNLLDARVIEKYIVKIIQLDAERAPFKYIQGEWDAKMQFPISKGAKRVNIKGFVDRLDEKEGVVRVLDYKTGSKEKMNFTSVDELFERNLKDHPKGIFQTFLYCLFYQNENGIKPIVPEIMKIPDLFKPDFATSIKDKTKNEFVDDFNEYRNEFEENLTNLLEEIFNQEIPFTQCTEISTCKYCPFKNICRREESEDNY